MTKSSEALAHASGTLVIVENDTRNGIEDVERWVRPQAGGQMKFLSIDPDVFEGLGGGSAGGGKSWALVLDALGLQFTSTEHGLSAHQTPGYCAALFRRESTQLAKLLDEARVLYPLFGGVYTAQRRGDPGPCFEFPTGDPLSPAKIYFCHLEHELDKESHQGASYQYVGFDELTHFTLTQYLYLFSRCRGKVGIKPRVRSTTNPVGEGLWWVRKRFINNLTPGKTSWFVMRGEPEDNPPGIKTVRHDPGALGRVFVPMSLRENKILLSLDPEYINRIKAMGDRMARALLDGDWNAFGGDFFSTFSQSQVIKPFQVPDDWELVLSIDPGSSGTCSAGLTAADYVGNYYRLATYYENMRNPDQNAAAIKKFYEDFKWTNGRAPTRSICGLDAWAKMDRFAVIAHGRTFADVFEAHGMLLERAVTDRKNGWWNWKNLFAPKPRWFVFEGTNEPLLEEMMAAVYDEKDSEDIKGRGNDPEIKDHALDDNRYSLMSIVQAERRPEKRGWAYPDYKKLRGVQHLEGWKVGRG